MGGGEGWVGRETGEYRDREVRTEGLRMMGTEDQREKEGQRAVGGPEMGDGEGGQVFMG